MDNSSIPASQILVERMCGLCEPDISDFHKTLFEPGCGEGNFLVEILNRRLQHAKTQDEILLALSNIYAVDISSAKIKIAHTRLQDLVATKFKKISVYNDAALPAVRSIIEKNIIVADFLSPEFNQQLESWAYHAS